MRAHYNKLEVETDEFNNYQHTDRLDVRVKENEYKYNPNFQIIDEILLKSQRSRSNSKKLLAPIKERIKQQVRRSFE